MTACGVLEDHQACESMRKVVVILKSMKNPISKEVENGSLFLDEADYIIYDNGKRNINHFAISVIGIVTDLQILKYDSI